MSATGATPGVRGGGRRQGSAEVQVQILDYRRFHEGVVPGPVWLTGQDKIVIFTIQSVWTCTSMLVAYESCDPDIQVL